jgi:hypothetical protein
MPQLYESLRQSLSDPSFFYVTGSPYQLYPFLHSFIQDTYPHGPLFLQNLSFVDVPGVIDFMSLNGTLEYKVQMNERIRSFFPKKEFLAIGDSTQKDPEAYASSYVFFHIRLCLTIDRPFNLQKGSVNMKEISLNASGSERWKVLTTRRSVSMPLFKVLIRAGLERSVIQMS